MVTINGAQYLVMGDAIYPQNLPPGLDAYGGYDNGNWPDFTAVAAAHPGTRLLDFSVFRVNIGTGGDFEPGDMSPTDAVPYVAARLAAGVWRPVAYASIGGYMPAVASDLAARWPRTAYRLLSAHYGWPGQLQGGQIGQHICGPATCGSPIQCDGTQWIDHGGWDESLLAADFFIQQAPVTSGGTQTYPAIQGAGKMFVPFETTTGADGSAYVAIPLPAGTSRVMNADVDVLDGTAFAPPHHDGDITASNPSGVNVRRSVGHKPATPGTEWVRITGAIPNHFYTGVAEVA